MRVLLTGAAGYLGQAVARALLGAGHEVTGVVRTAVGQQSLAASGMEAVRGDLDDVPGLRTVVEGVDAVVETASADNPAAARGLVEILSGTGKKLVRTSGIGIYSVFTAGGCSEQVFAEDFDFTPHEFYNPRLETDRVTVAAARAGVHSVVLRPGMVYGGGASEQLPVLLRAALRDGVSRYLGQGLNHYANVYVDDLAAAYVLALEGAPAGSVYNLTAGENTLREIAEGVATVLGLGPAVSVTVEENVKALGPLYGLGMSVAARADSSKVRAELGWAPVGPSLLEDLTKGSYRRVWAQRVPMATG
jgi:nucleoside-diphosphate-sugar epimerase